MLPALLVALSLTTAAPATKTVTSADSGKTVTIAKHQKLQIELSECGSCGYSWKTTVKPAPKVLKRRTVLHKDPTCQPPCAGGSYTTVFRYTGKAAGRTKLRLGYFGPGRSKSSDTFRLTLRVR
jgi:predicted secreted protein